MVAVRDATDAACRETPRPRTRYAGPRAAARAPPEVAIRGSLMGTFGTARQRRSSSSVGSVMLHRARPVYAKVANRQSMVALVGDLLRRAAVEIRQPPVGCLHNEPRRDAREEQGHRSPPNVWRNG